MADQQVALATIAAYQRATTTLRDQMTAFLGHLWASLGIYRNEQMAEFVNQIGPVLQGAEQQMSALTTGYLAQYRQVMLDDPGTPAVVRTERVTGDATRNGTPPEKVYERPFHQVWRDLSNDIQPEKAIAHGLAVAEKAIVTDLQRTKTLTALEVTAADEQLQGYRRVLEGAHSCGLCIVASTQLYHKATLMPIHPGCDCGSAPVYGEDDDPGQVLNEQLLQDVHAAIEDTFGISSSAAREIPGQWADGKPIRYQDVLIVHEHGELGPVLGVRGHKFTGPSDLRTI